MVGRTNYEGRRVGVVGDIVIGMIGALIGGLLWSLIVATIGAIILLFVLRLFKRA